MSEANGGGGGEDARAKLVTSTPPTVTTSASLQWRHLPRPAGEYKDIGASACLLH